MNSTITSNNTYYDIQLMVEPGEYKPKRRKPRQVHPDIWKDRVKICKMLADKALTQEIETQIKYDLSYQFPRDMFVVTAYIMNDYLHKNRSTKPYVKPDRTQFRETEQDVIAYMAIWYDPETDMLGVYKQARSHAERHFHEYIDSVI